MTAKGIVRHLVLAGGAAAALVAARNARAQTPRSFGVCVPVAQRAGRDVGCFIIAEQHVGAVDTAHTFWHVTRFASTADAERANRNARVRGTVIRAFDSSWLLTIADSAWRPRRGRAVANIGPLPVRAGVTYSALFMEASMRPGMKSTVHRHSGPEAWYTLSGATCLETPQGTQVGRAGNAPVIVPGGSPMELTAIGTSVRRSLVLILHDAAQPPTTMDSSWTPRGRCAAAR